MHVYTNQWFLVTCYQWTSEPVIRVGYMWTKSKLSIKHINKILKIWKYGNIPFLSRIIVGRQYGKRSNGNIHCNEKWKQRRCTKRPPPVHRQKMLLSRKSGTVFQRVASINMSCHSPWWRHQMETFSALLALCAGNSPFTGEFPA